MIRAVRRNGPGFRVLSDQAGKTPFNRFPQHGAGRLYIYAAGVHAGVERQIHNLRHGNIARGNGRTAASAAYQRYNGQILIFRAFEVPLRLAEPAVCLQGNGIGFTTPGNGGYIFPIAIVPAVQPHGDIGKHASGNAVHFLANAVQVVLHFLILSIICKRISGCDGLAFRRKDITGIRIDGNFNISHRSCARTGGNNQGITRLLSIRPHHGLMEMRINNHIDALYVFGNAVGGVSVLADHLGIITQMGYADDHICSLVLKMIHSILGSVNHIANGNSHVYGRVASGQCGGRGKAKKANLYPLTLNDAPVRLGIQHLIAQHIPGHDRHRAAHQLLARFRNQRADKVRTICRKFMIAQRGHIVAGKAHGIDGAQAIRHGHINRSLGEVSPIHQNGIFEFIFHRSNLAVSNHGFGGICNAGPMHIIGMQNVQYNDAIIFFGKRKTDNHGEKHTYRQEKCPDSFHVWIPPIYF